MVVSFLALETCVSIDYDLTIARRRDAMQAVVAEQEQQERVGVLHLQRDGTLAA